MPLPLFIGIGAAIAGLSGIGAGVFGGVKMAEANDTMTKTQERHEKNVKRFEKANQETTKTMDKLGELELGIIKSFSEFAELIEKIQNRPDFKKIQKDGEEIPTYSPQELEQVSIGAGVLIGGLSGAAAGTAGGFAAAGATTAAVMALGTASTGTAIASLSGVAATNATLAALGGGALAAGGGGMALGSAVLGGATLGVGLLVGGIIFGITGGVLSGKAEEAKKQMLEAEADIDKICKYLGELNTCAADYYSSLDKLNTIYISSIEKLNNFIVGQGITDWNIFSEDSKLLVENTSYLVGLLYNMCKVRLVLKAENDNEVNIINHKEIDKAQKLASEFLESE